jgi:flagellar biosynthesis chaperone FliJ
MDKEQLENRIKELGVLIEEASGNVKKLVDEQNTLTQDLEDLNKPKLTDAQWNEISDIIIRACEAFDPNLNDAEVELELDYNNCVTVNSIELGYQMTDLGDHIVDRLTEVFGTVKE